MRLHFIEQPDWPPLAWLASCESSSQTVAVHHGSWVEVSERWFCEAVWAGDYSRGDFDQTDLVAGSGGRLRDDRLIFVSSGSTIDRLNSVSVPGRTWVSNSLPCLLAAAQATVNPSYRWYYRDSLSIMEGLHRYKRRLSTSLGHVELTYFDNLRWDGMRLLAEPKPTPRRDFSTFEKYRSFLTTSIAEVAANGEAPARRHRWRLLGTLSSGYDSTAISALARPHGLTEVVTFDRTRSGADDSGKAAADVLGLKAHSVSRETWRTAQSPEIPFIASYSAAGDIIFKGAEAHLVGRVLLTGYHGDKVWDKHTKDLTDQIVRGDSSGLALTEYRLWVGFLNCPVAFWGVRQIREINALSNSSEMKPWDVSGDYSRPICRRIAEEAGVPRAAFGTRKRFITVDPFGGWDTLNSGLDLLTPASQQDYLAWLRKNRAAWLRRGKVPPIASPRLNRWINALYRRWINLVSPLAGKRFVWRFIRGRLYHPRYLGWYLFPWSIERAKERYRR